MRQYNLQLSYDPLSTFGTDRGYTIYILDYPKVGNREVLVNCLTRSQAERIMRNPSFNIPDQNDLSWSVEWGWNELQTAGRWAMARLAY